MVARSRRSRSRAVRVSRRVSTQMIGVATTSMASRPPMVIRWNGASTCGPSIGDVVGGEVDLEQHRLALGRVDPGVDLDQSSGRRLVAVLRLGQVGDLRLGAAPLEDPALLLVERVPRADQAGLVGVEDGAVAPPDLDASYVADEESLEHLAVELVDRSGVAVDEALRDRGLGDRAGQHLGDGPGVGPGLGGGDPGAEHRGGHGEGDEEHDGDREVLHHGVADEPHPATLGARLTNRRCRDTPHPS